MRSYYNYYFRNIKNNLKMTTYQLTTLWILQKEYPNNQIVLFKDKYYLI